MADKRKKRDPAREYCTEIHGTMGTGCNFCQHVIKAGGITRLKYHLTGLDPGCNVIRCEKVPKEVKEYVISLSNSKAKDKAHKAAVMEDIRAELRGVHVNLSDSEDDDGDMGQQERANVQEALRASRNSIRGQSSGHGGARSSQFERTQSVREQLPLAPDLRNSYRGRQKGIKNLFSKGSVKEAMGRLVSKFFIYENVPAHKASSPHFHNLVMGCQAAGEGVLPPTPYEIRNKYLEMEFSEITDYVNSLRQQWETYGCTIMCDGWTGPTKLSIINFMVYSKGNTIFLKSVDSSGDKKDYKYIYSLLKEIILNVGEKNVIQVVTDDGSNYVKAGKKVMKNHNIYWTSCAAHCIDLMFEEMGKKPAVAEVITKGKIISNFLYNHNLLLDKMREYCNGEIVRAAPTRFATNFISLESLLKRKAGLKQLFASDWWTDSSFCRTPQGRKTEGIVFDQSFWANADTVCAVSEPLYKVLRVVDTEVYPTMSTVYELIRKVKLEFESMRGAQWVVKIINDRWYKTLSHDLHSAAYYLNPRYHYKPGVGVDPDLIMAVHNVFTKLDPNSPSMGSFGQELIYFRDAMKSFATGPAKAARDQMAPADWWFMYGTSSPTVRTLAIKVLSQTASASACERNWSTFALIHTKQRNKLGYQKLEKLVYCYYNMRLKIRDREAELDQVGERDPLEAFDIGTEFDDEQRDQLYDWIRPLHLDDDNRNPAPRVAEVAREIGINVERVIQEEVLGSDEETSFERAMEPPRNHLESHGSRFPSRTNDQSTTRSSGSPSNRGGSGEGYSEAGGGGGGVQDSGYYMSPFTNEANFNYATQDEDHGDRNAGHGAIKRNDNPRQRDQGSWSTPQEDSISESFSSISVGERNYNPYGYWQSLEMSYPSHFIPYGTQSGESSGQQSEGQSSNNFGHGQTQAAVQDPYGWHVNNYMQNYKEELSFNDYSSCFTRDSTQMDEDFEPHRQSLWY